MTANEKGIKCQSRGIPRVGIFFMELCIDAKSVMYGNNMQLP